MSTVIPHSPCREADMPKSPAEGKNKFPPDTEINIKIIEKYHSLQAKQREVKVMANPNFVLELIDPALISAVQAQGFELMLVQYPANSEAKRFAHHIISTAAATLRARRPGVTIPFLHEFINSATIGPDCQVGADLNCGTLNVIDGHMFFDANQAESRFAECVLASSLNDNTFPLTFIFKASRRVQTVFVHYNVNLIYTNKN